MEPSNDSGAGAKPERPSLMNPAPADNAAKGAGSIRLLEAIERETSARPPTGGKRSAKGWLLGGSGALALAVGWLWFSNATSPSSETSEALASAAPPAASAAAPAAPAASTTTSVAAVEPAASDVKVAAADTAMDAASGAARIERLDSADAAASRPPALPAVLRDDGPSVAGAKDHSSPPATAAAALANSSLAEGRAAEPAGRQSKAEPALAQADTAAKSKASSAKPADNSNAPSAKARAAAERNVAAAKAKANNTSKTTARRGPEVDPDADVVAAIMASLDKRGAAPLGALPATAGAATAGAATGAPPTARSARSIADLVSRCNSLPDEEMLACRRRICDGYWGKAQACPGSLAPHSAATARP